MWYSGLLVRFNGKPKTWFKVLATIGLSNPRIIASFLIVFISQLLVLIRDPDPLRESTECPLYGTVVTHRLFCSPLTRIGAVLALILPGFPILIGVIETAGGHVAVGAVKLCGLVADLITVCISILLAWYLGGLLIWMNASELHAESMDPTTGIQLNGTTLHSRSYSELFVAPPSSYRWKVAYAIAFLLFSIPTFNGAVFSRKTIIHKRFLRQVFIAAGALVARVAIMHYWSHYRFLPLQLRSTIDGILIGSLAMLTSWLGILVPPCRIRRPHPAVTYPAMFLMLPFSTLLPLLESIADQRVYDFMMGQGGGAQLGPFFVGVAWQLGTSVAGLAIGIVLFGGAMFRKY